MWRYCGDGSARRSREIPTTWFTLYHVDEHDPDVIVAYQRYRDAEAAEAFLRTEAYASYTAEVEPLLAGPPVVTVLRTLWAKDG